MERNNAMAETLHHLSTPCVISIYIGCNPFLTDVEDINATPDAAFMDAVEAELDRRDIRSLDNEIGWDVSNMPDAELSNLEAYLVDCWDGVKKGMLKTIAEGWEKKRAKEEAK